MEWTEWESFKEGKIREIPERAGIYQFRCLDEEGKPILISRLRKKDALGIIYIGQTENLQRRINNFWKTITRRERSLHAAGWTYISCCYDELFPPENLQFRYKVTKNSIDEEFMLLLSYLKEFRDLPPLNSNRGRYPDNWEKKWKEVFGRLPLQ